MTSLTSFEEVCAFSKGALTDISLCSGVPQKLDEIRERALFFLNIHYDAVK